MLEPNIENFVNSLINFNEFKNNMNLNHYHDFAKKVINALIKRFKFPYKAFIFFNYTPDWNDGEPCEIETYFDFLDDISIVYSRGVPYIMINNEHSSYDSSIEEIYENSSQFMKNFSFDSNEYIDFENLPDFSEYPVEVIYHLLKLKINDNEDEDKLTLTIPDEYKINYNLINRIDVMDFIKVFKLFTHLMYDTNFYLILKINEFGEYDLLYQRYIP